MMPSAGTNADFVPALFHYMADNYTEKLTFKKVQDGGVRNRGGYNEQYIGAVEYHQAITTAPKEGKGSGIHEENGMFLYLDHMQTHPLDEDTVKKDFSKVFQPKMEVGTGQEKFLTHYSICRSGTIPHGSTMQLLGRDYLPEDGAPTWPTGEATWDQNHMAIDFSMYKGEHPIKHDLDKPHPGFDLPPAGSPKEAYTVPQTHFLYVDRIFSHALYPYSVRPDLRLRDAIKGQNIKNHTFIDMGTRFSSNPQGGVLNTPMVQKYCNVTEVQFRMWIETVIEDGEEVLQLQYEQIVYMEFGFARDGSLTRWPHIQVNTLRKKDWVDAH